MKLRKISANCKLGYGRSTLCVFEAVYYSLGDEDFLDFVSGLALDLHDELLFALDDLSIFAVSRELEVDLGLEACDVDLPLRGLSQFLWLVVSHCKN